MRLRRVRPMGPLAWLVDCSPDEVAALAEELRARPVPGQTAVRSGASSVLVSVRPGPSTAAREELVSRPLLTQGAPSWSGVAHVVSVVYDGPDRERLAAELGVSVDALLARHQEQGWTVAFCGFAPGFAYLRGWELEVPRLETPRPAVPAGSVAVAGAFGAVYPGASPGGWQLLGRTDAAVWDVDRNPPALLAPGDRVRWRSIRARAVGASVHHGSGPPTATAPPGADAGRGQGGALTILEAGPLTLIEDLGRPGLEHLGVCASGAADAGAARRANRLVGNPRAAAVLETLGGLRLRAERDLVVAHDGAESDATIEPAPARGAAASAVTRVSAATPWALRAGEVLTIGHPRHGLRTYLAVRGGIEVAPVLGSRSCDVLAMLGPGRLEAGQVLDLGRTTMPVGAPQAPWPGHGTSATRVRLVVGPRDEEFGAAGMSALLGQDWTVSATSNRVGLRLQGARLERLVMGELPSEPMVPGAIQVPPSGEPVVLFRDHPVTGGYPVIGVVVPEDLDLLAQIRPGERLRLQSVDADLRPLYPTGAMPDSGPSAHLARDLPT